MVTVLGSREVSILLASEDGSCSRVELVGTDPVTGLRHRGLRHRARFELVVEDGKIRSVVETSEMVG